MRGAPGTLVRSEGIRSPVAMIVPSAGAKVMAAPAQKKVLHGEDDLVRATLVRDGYEVHTASSGARAIELAVLRRPDVVLLDLNLPGMNGIEALKSMRSLEALRQVPVVFLTSSRDLLTHLELLALGAQVVHKPFRPGDLVRVVERVLERKQP